MKAKKVKFRLPEELKIPQSTEDTVDLMATIRIIGDGFAELEALDGHEVLPRKSLLDVVEDHFKDHG